MDGMGSGDVHLPCPDSHHNHQVNRQCLLAAARVVRDGSARGRPVTFFIPSSVRKRVEHLLLLAGEDVEKVMTKRVKASDPTKRALSAADREARKREKEEARARKELQAEMEEFLLADMLSEDDLDGEEYHTRAKSHRKQKEKGEEDWLDELPSEEDDFFAPLLQSGGGSKSGGRVGSGKKRRAKGTDPAEAGAPATKRRKSHSGGRSGASSKKQQLEMEKETQRLLRGASSFPPLSCDRTPLG